MAPFDLFVASGTIGTLILLLVYAVATQRAGERLMAEEGLIAETGSRTEGYR